MRLCRARASTLTGARLDELRLACWRATCQYERMTVKAHFDGKVLVPDEPVDWPVNQPLKVTVQPAEPGEPPLVKLARELATFPPNPNSPGDAAAQHDHYLYGLPKRQ